MSIVAFMDLAKGLIFNRIKISLWRCSIYSAIRVICKKHGNKVGYKSIKKIDFAFSRKWLSGLRLRQLQLYSVYRLTIIINTEPAAQS